MDPHGVASPRPALTEQQLADPTLVLQALREIVDDGEQMYALFELAAVAATRSGRIDDLVSYAAIAGEVEDRQRAYAVRRLTASLLLSWAQLARRDGADPSLWRDANRTVIDLLVPELERAPHEPELVQQLAVAVAQLGDRVAAQRLVDAVLTMEPAHADARALAAALASDDIAAVATLRRELHARLLSIADAASTIPDRSITLCMIVRDEEEMLPGCLAAVAEHVDEIVIVDTGSVDRTREIALEYGARIVEYPWTGHFSEARNVAHEHASGDWLLWLDADEHVVGSDGARLRDLARATWIEGWHVVETHFVGAAELGAAASHAPMRMFQRRPEYCWSGRVHEQVLWSLPTWLPDRLRHSDVRINHFGYLARVAAERDKRGRNLELLMAQVEEDRSAFTCFNVGTEHASSGAWDDARLWLEEAYQLATAASDRWHTEQYAPLLVQRLVAARRATGDIDGALQLAAIGLQAWPEFTDLAYEQALCHAALGEHERAAERARTAIEMGDAPARFVSIAGRGSFQARMLLAASLEHLDEPDEARTQLERAIGEAPQYLEATVRLVDLLLKEHDGAAVSKRLDQLRADPPGAAAPNMLIGAALHEAGELRAANERYARVLAAHPRHAGALLASAEIRMSDGELSDAWTLAMSIDELDPMAPHGACSAFLSAVVLDDLELCRKAMERIIDASGVLSAPERAVYLAWHALVDPAASGGAAVLVPADDQAADVVLRNLEALARLEAADAFERLHPVLAQAMPDSYSRRLALADVYLRRQFADMAGEELMACADEHGADAHVLTRLGKVATLKGLWDDAAVFLDESLRLDPRQADARSLLAAVQQRSAG